MSRKPTRRYMALRKRRKVRKQWGFPKGSKIVSVRITWDVGFPAHSTLFMPTSSIMYRRRMYATKGYRYV